MVIGLNQMGPFAMSFMSSAASSTIAEMREFASFTAAERSFIERSIDIAFGRSDAFKAWSRSAADTCAIRSQYIAYREIAALREAIPCVDTFEGVAEFTGGLIRVSVQDLAQEQLGGFAAYRFLYERLLGARARPFLPGAFCGAAALPQIRPERRKLLLQSLSEAAATAPAWSRREPAFMPERIAIETV